MLQAIIVIIVIAAIVFLVTAGRSKRRKQAEANQFPADAPHLLDMHVHFYKQLDAAQRTIFENRLRDFLSHTKVTGVGVTVTDLDRLLVAASAIIPIAAFPTWQYQNINEVLLYPDTFNKEYATEGTDRNVLGMVGNGAMNGQMILSQPALRDGFKREEGHNTGIHEFVHLLDKADGSVDGIPEYLLAQPYILPWVTQMHKEIHQMREHHTDIDAYGATNDAEFFAVVAEYFFERPEALKEHHPALFALLIKMFQPTEQASQ